MAHETGLGDSATSATSASTSNITDHTPELASGIGEDPVTAGQAAHSHQSPRADVRSAGTLGLGPGTDGAGLSAAPLLTTKLYVPRLRTDLVTRTRLIAHLGQAVRGPVSLVAAPAGWGKTMLLAAWHADPEREPWPVGWVSLDAGDNDPMRFWTYVLAALNQAHPGVADAALALLRASQPPALDAALTLLVNALADLPADVVLVLDDYHLVTAEPIHIALAALLDHLPPRLHLVLAAREDPQLPLARLRVAGALSELRAADLRVTQDEAASVLEQAVGAPLPAEAVAALQARTEGWIAGLQLAALSIRGRAGERIDDFIRAFTGSNRYIVDYLIEEVLARQPPAVQTFLLRTAVLDRFCAPLCERLLANVDPPAVSRPSIPVSASGDTAPAAAPRPLAAQATLEQLERANLFLIPLDDERRWYRYHHLFADVLRSRLRHLEPDLPAKLHQRASAWFEEQGLVIEAIDQALAAPDVECAARLIERHEFAIGKLGVGGQVQTVLGWLRALPAALVRSRPMLCASEAIMLFLSGHAAEAVEARLDDAEAAVAANLRAGAAEPELRPIIGILAHIRALVALLPGDLPRNVALAREALTLLPESEVGWRTTARYFASRSYLVTGDVRGAAVEHALADEMAALHAVGNLVVALASGADLAYLHVLQGHLRVAAATYREALHAIPAPIQPEDLLSGPGVCFGLGEVLLEWNELEGADRLLTGGMRMLERWVSPAHAVTKGYVALARLRQARGEGAAALEALDAFAEMADRRHFTAELRALGAATRARVHLAQGDLTTAMRWADGAGLSADDTDLPFPREREYLTLARVRITQGRIAQGRTTPSSPALNEALRLLERLERAAATQGRGGSVLEIQILRALALQAQGRQAAALAALARALLLAEPEGYVRLFADEGQPMAVLLSRLLTAIRQGRLAATDTTVAHIHTLRDACGGLHHAQAATYVDDASSDLSVPATSFQSPAAPADAADGGMTHSTGSPPQLTPLVTPLTAREVEVLRLLAKGAANADIAQLLVLSVGTVKTHVYNICMKLGVRTRAQAVARARALHLL